jgi:hypothetical protein
MKNVDQAGVSKQVLFLISVCGGPVAIVPARSVEDARTRAIALISTSPEDVANVAEHGVSVLLFVPTIQADGQTIGYTPAAFGSFENDGSGTWTTRPGAIGPVN